MVLSHNLPPYSILCLRTIQPCPDFGKIASVMVSFLSVRQSLKSSSLSWTGLGLVIHARAAQIVAPQSWLGQHVVDYEAIGVFFRPADS